ncbi:hypothetical protein MAN_05628, partial [Metarhizium hybridum]
MAPGTSLPPPVDPALIATLLTFLSLPPATSIAPLEANAAFHRIYLIHYASPPPPELRDLRRSPGGGGTSLVLRVSGPQAPPYLKTANEVAVMAWGRGGARPAARGYLLVLAGRRGRVWHRRAGGGAGRAGPVRVARRLRQGLRGRVCACDLRAGAAGLGCRA